MWNILLSSSLWNVFLHYFFFFLKSKYKVNTWSLLSICCKSCIIVIIILEFIAKCSKIISSGWCLLLGFFLNFLWELDYSLRSCLEVAWWCFIGLTFMCGWMSNTWCGIYIFPTPRFSYWCRFGWLWWWNTNAMNGLIGKSPTKGGGISFSIKCHQSLMFKSRLWN